MLKQAIKPPATFTFSRSASHASQGRANGPKDSAGRRLGAKKSASEYVVPGNIIFRQRGTKWFPGENVSIGKDHTIYSIEHGYVRFYRDPQKHPKRRYIGVSLARDGPKSILPTPPNAVRRRRLNMIAVPRTPEPGAPSQLPTSPDVIASGTPLQQRPLVERLRTGHAYREVNWEIGRSAERAGITVRDFDRKDRWLAWRKRQIKAKKTAFLKATRADRKGKGKQKARQAAKSGKTRK
ncbi:MAG: hypothetical protein Q9160_008421 [Pyrenula sp. 1 TL-2023]